MTDKKKSGRPRRRSQKVESPILPPKPSKSSNKIALIFGSGPSIHMYHQQIPRLIEKFTSVGINFFPTAFVDRYIPLPVEKYSKSLPTDYWIISDECISYLFRENRNNQHLLVNRHISEAEFKKFEDSNLPFTAFSYSDIPTTEAKLDRTNSVPLYGIYSSVIPATNFLLLQGYTDIILFGIDNQTSTNKLWNHFYTEEKRNIKNIDQLIDIQVQLVTLISTFKDAKIYITGKSALPFDRINVDTLLEKGEIDFNFPHRPAPTEVLFKYKLPPQIKGGRTVGIGSKSFQVVDDHIYVPPMYVVNMEALGFRRVMDEE